MKSMSGGFPRFLNGGQQEGHKDANDGDHDQELDEGEGAPLQTETGRERHSWLTRVGKGLGFEEAILGRD